MTCCSICASRFLRVHSGSTFRAQASDCRWVSRACVSVPAMNSERSAADSAASQALRTETALVPRLGTGAQAPKAQLVDILPKFKWRRGWDYSALRASPLRGRPSGVIPASFLSQSADPCRAELMSLVAERVGFEPTCRNYPTIRFRVGAVMTTSVPLRLT